MIAGVALAAWTRCPAAALGIFLGLSVEHFSEMGARNRSLVAILAVGAAHIVVPSMVRTKDTAALLRLLVVPGGNDVIIATRAGALIRMPCTIATIIRPKPGRTRLEIGFVAAIFAAMKLISTLAIYFAGLHAPLAFNAATRTLRKNRVSRLRDAAPPSVATIVMPGTCFFLTRRVTPDRDALLRNTFIGLAAPGVPRIMLSAIEGKMRAFEDSGSGSLKSAPKTD